MLRTGKTVLAKKAARKVRDASAWLFSWLWGLAQVIGRWFRKYGFAILVLVALGSAGYLAANVAIPDPVPDFALQSKEIYRLEIGAAFFVVFYLAVMTFVLALSGRGFAQIGTKGVAADEVVVNRKQNLAFRTLARSTRSALTGIADLRAGFRNVDKALESHEERLEKLEKKPRTAGKAKS